MKQWIKYLFTSTPASDMTWVVMHVCLAIYTGIMGWMWVSGLCTGLSGFWLLAYFFDKYKATAVDVIEAQRQWIEYLEK